MESAYIRGEHPSQDRFVPFLLHVTHHHNPLQYNRYHIPIAPQQQSASMANFPIPTNGASISFPIGMGQPVYATSLQTTNPRSFDETNTPTVPDHDIVTPLFIPVNVPCKVVISPGDGRPWVTAWFKNDLGCELTPETDRSDPCSDTWDPDSPAYNNEAELSAVQYLTNPDLIRAIETRGVPLNPNYRPPQNNTNSQVYEWKTDEDQLRPLLYPYHVNNDYVDTTLTLQVVTVTGPFFVVSRHGHEMLMEVGRMRHLLLPGPFVSGYVAVGSTSGANGGANGDASGGSYGDSNRGSNGRGFGRMMGFRNGGTNGRPTNGDTKRDANGAFNGATNGATNREATNGSMNEHQSEDPPLPNERVEEPMDGDEYNKRSKTHWPNFLSKTRFSRPDRGEEEGKKFIRKRYDSLNPFKTEDSEEGIVGEGSEGSKESKENKESKRNKGSKVQHSTKKFFRTLSHFPLGPGSVAVR
jgi:hypothetical protein